MNTTELGKLLGVGGDGELARRYRALEACNSDIARYLRCKAFDERRRVPVHLDVISKYDRFDIAYRREFHALRRLNHPAIIKPYDFFEDERCVVMATEWVEGEPFTTVGIDAHTQESKVCFLAELAKVLAFAESCGVRHFDLQPDRILVIASSCDSEPRRVVRGVGFAPDIGWGASGDDRWTCLRHNCYSPHDESAERSESYSWGVIAFELLSGVLPFCADDEIAIKIMHRSLPAPLLHEMSDAPAWLSSLVAACLDKRPNTRPTLNEIIDCLQQQREPRVKRPSSSISTAWSNQEVYREYLDHLIVQNQARLGFAPAASLAERLRSLRK